LGCIKPAVESVGGEVESYFFIADMHALTTFKGAGAMQHGIRDIACTWLACGLDPKKTTFYRQSDVPEIFEIYTVLGNFTPKGLMDRAHAYKAKVADGLDANMGLYNYPLLMTADILAFNTNFVPVGSDQAQHVEMASDIAKAFNAVCGKTFVEPSAVIKKDVGIIAGTDGRKMSKSYNNTIPLFGSREELLKSVKKITTDSTAPDAPKDPGHVIFGLYKLFTGTEMDTRVGWGDAKMKLFEAMDAYIAPMRERYDYLMSHWGEVERILAEGAERARAVARETLARVKKAVGISGEGHK